MRLIQHFIYGLFCLGLILLSVGFFAACLSLSVLWGAPLWLAIVAGIIGFLIGVSLSMFLHTGFYPDRDGSWISKMFDGLNGL